MSQEKDYEIISVQAEPVYRQGDAIERANIDGQIATAKAYPRNVEKSLENSILTATMDEETAKSCSYALPKGGKYIMGPTVHLANILVSNWGNMRTDKKIVKITHDRVYSRGVAWDLETNTASAIEVSRSIIDKNGRRYNDDMITLTGNAASSIAYRNAVLNVIPIAISQKVYKEAQKLITDDLSDDTKLIKRRNDAINYFSGFGITEEEVVKLCGKQTVNQIKADELSLLLGMAQALKDGDTTVEELMQPIRGSRERKNEKLKELAMMSTEKKEKNDK